MLNLISWNLHSYSKFEVHIIFILKKAYDVVDFDKSQNKYDSHTNPKILTGRCVFVFALLAALSFLFISEFFFFLL